MIQRYREIHDMLHTLLGMPTNILGECWPASSPWMLPEWGRVEAYPVRGLSGGRALHSACLPIYLQGQVRAHLFEPLTS